MGNIAVNSRSRADVRLSVIFVNCDKTKAPSEKKVQLRRTGSQLQAFQ